MGTDDRTGEPKSNATLIAALVIGFCLVLGVIVWAGGWGFSNDRVSSPNPAQHAGNTSPPAQMPIRSTTGSR
jgi:hypothetical protein